MRLLLLFILFIISGIASAQPDSADYRYYRATPERINNLVHTKLDARFDYLKQQMAGKVWITLKPHFYPTDSLTLDAKAMDIRQVSISKAGKLTPLKYTYDGMQLHIKLDRSYKNHESYMVFIDYIAKPEEYEGKGSAAITGAKGLYFINPLGDDKNKPVQIWTQGETEATSVWVPTIDKPNQKTTQEISMTVPAKYVTLSNGKLSAQRKNADGTRTDTWKMDQPHAPYLFFMGVGDYAVVKDQYKGKEVSYYVEKEYAPVARRIFGMTPDMMALYSRLTGIEYPWVKYAQMVARDYVSGAMENTTATLHGESAQQDARELTDGNHWEEVIAHELFHHWFGDLVTTESWSNLTINESFATLGSQLWNEYRYGKDAADAERYGSLQGYYNSRSEEKPLVRFYYKEKEDVFDAVSYNKGGGILQMLRHYIGDSAFYKGMNLILNRYKYQPIEAHQLRLAYEEVTGKDLNWFFNQWFFGSGHPKFDINYSYDNTAKQVRMTVQQTQDGQTFQVPVRVGLWSASQPVYHTIWTATKSDTFYFPSATKPLLVNFDADKILVAERKENKSLDEYLYQYKVANNYFDRREAINAALRNQAEVTAVELIRLALRDPFGPLRAYTISNLDMQKQSIRAAVENQLATVAQKDTYRPAKAAAIFKLSETKSAQYAPIYAAAVNDSSYTVAGNALQALSQVDSAAAAVAARRLSGQPAKGRLSLALTNILIQSGDESAAVSLLQAFEQMPLSNEKFETMVKLREVLKIVKTPDIFKRGIDGMMNFMDKIPEQYKPQLEPVIRAWVEDIQKSKQNNGETELANYAGEKLKG